MARLRGRLDHLVHRHVRGGPERLEEPVREVLRLGAYEALYMDGVPAYAAVSQAVEQARATSGRGAAGLVNAVLRRVASDGDDPERFPRSDADPGGFLEAWGSHPRWLVDRWLARWSAAEVRRLVEEDNSRPRLHLVPLDGDAEGAARALGEAGIEAHPVGRGTDCVVVASGTAPAAALAVRPAVVQDPGANLVVRYADPPPGTKVADLCAAPGGKALALSAGASYTVACDPSEVRMRLLKDNAGRTGARVGMVVADGRRPPLRGADVVLLDVPCSGTGTLRRHPDARWRLDEPAIARLAALQSDILDGAAPLVPPGGLLVYATCTLEPEENEAQVEAFLARRPDFRIDAGRATTHVGDDGCLRVLPHETGFDGAFAARLRRVA